LITEAETPARGERRRQRTKLIALATFLICAGLLILFALERVPAPLRIVSGLGDVVAGCVLLVLARQKFRH
jgi:hypothetical protein